MIEEKKLARYLFSFIFFARGGEFEKGEGVLFYSI